MPLYIAQSGDLDRCHRCLADSHLKDRATQLLIKYKSGALVAQYINDGKRKQKLLLRYADYTVLRDTSPPRRFSRQTKPRY